MSATFPRRPRLAVALVVVPCLLLLFVKVHDVLMPGEMQSVSPPCLIKKVTGFSCAFCGATRATFAFLRGEWFEAWAYNYFLAVALPWVLFAYVQYIMCLWGCMPVEVANTRNRRIALWGAPAVLIWTVVRNYLAC